jgi:NADH-quinone oxidoreductase subunit J
MTRPLLAAAVALALLVLAGGGAALAQPGTAPTPIVIQPAPNGAGAGGGDQAAPAPADGTAEASQATAPASGPGFANSRSAALLFWIFALAVIGGALFVITRKNLIAAVMGMVGTFFALAGLYAMLYAHFLAAIQVLVYAGAIMVLFVFVVMILNRPEDEPWALEGLFGKALAGLAILYLVVRMTGVLWGIKDTPHAVIAGPKPSVPAEIGAPIRTGALGSPAEAAARQDDWGSTRAVGKALFRDYLFPFEAVSLVLLVAVVGGLAVARPHHRDEEPPRSETVA